MKAEGTETATLTLTYVNWDSEVASNHVLAEALQQAGYEVQLVPLDVAVMWQSIANGEADAMICAWLPHTSMNQMAVYQDQVVDLGPNLDQAQVGLVVPAYMEVDSIEDLTTQAQQAITGIEAGSGQILVTEQALKDYQLKDWTIETSSSGAMATALGQAIQKEEEIVVTAWSPHWLFAEYDLKFLEDPLKVFGKAESIHTICRQGLEEDDPQAYRILKQFYWTVEDMEEVMLAISNGQSPEEAAKDWVTQNQDTVDQWLETKN